MAYPLEQRFKNLQHSMGNETSEPWGSHRMRPQLIPGIVTGYSARNDSGYCLLVLPLQPTNVTLTGDLTFPTVGASSSSSGVQYPLRVYPIDTAPTAVQSAFPVGSIIDFYPYWAGGKYAQEVTGTLVCRSGIAGDNTVKLEMDGGSDGDAATYLEATWTYTCTDLNGNQLATNLPLYGHRPLAQTTSPATIGTLFLVNNPGDIGYGGSQDVAVNDGNGYGFTGTATPTGAGSTNQPYRLKDIDEAFPMSPCTSSSSSGGSSSSSGGG